MAGNWQSEANDTVAQMEAEVGTHEKRKVFYAKGGDGVQRAQALIGYFDALKARLEKLVRHV